MLDFPRSALAGALGGWEGGEYVENNLWRGFLCPLPQAGD